MDPAGPAAPLPSTPFTDTVETDRPCLSCGYNLRTLAVSGVCPECGQPVLRSLQGKLLRFSAPDYVARLHTGVFLAQAGVILMLLLTIGLIFVVVLAASGPWGLDIEGTFNALQAGAGMISLIGWWLLSSPDPAFVGTDDGSTARKVVRVSVAVSLVATVLTIPFGSVNLGAAATRAGAAGWATAMAVSIIHLIAWIVWYLAAMRYIRWLAPRLPSQRVADRAKMLTWLGPVLYVFGCGIGQLVALVFYYNLLDWIRLDLKRIRDEQASEGASVIPPPL